MLEFGVLDTNLDLLDLARWQEQNGGEGRRKKG
jgi:hypothetical protein